MTRHFLCLGILLLCLATNAQQKKWTLEACINHALDNNLAVKQGENTLLSNEQDVISAKGNFLPSVQGTLGFSANIGFGIDGNTGLAINNNTRFSTNYGIRASQTIFNGFRNLNLYKQSRLTQETNELELKKIKDDISLNVVNAYLNVLFNKENLEAAKAQYEFSKKQLEQVKELVDAGVQPKANIYDADATLSRDEQQVTLAENSFNLSLLTLSQLLQLSFNGFDIEIIKVDTPSTAFLYNNIQPILDYAFKNRNEIKIAEKDIENAELNTEISKSGFLPSASLGYSFGSSFAESKIDLIKIPFFYELDQLKAHNFSLNVSIPIFSRFQNKTSVAKSKIQEANSKLNLQQAKLNLESNIQAAYTDAQAALKAYIAAKKSLASQQLAFNNSKERYDIGNMTAFDLEQARVQLINAQSSLINAKYDFVFKTKVLDFYMGKSLTD